MDAQATGAMGFINGMIHSSWFPLLGIFVVVYFLLGLLEDAFGFGKPVRVIVAIIATLGYKYFEAGIWASICSFFTALGLKV